MSEEQEIQIMKNTTLELPLEKLSADPLPRSPALPSFTLSLKEVTTGGDWRFADGRTELQKQFNDGEELDYLEIKFTIGGDDPRIKAFDVYTQYSGINTVLIKHAPAVWPCGTAFYKAIPDWDHQQDRILNVGEVRPTKLEGPASYRRATGLKAKSWPLEGSENGQITVGMCRGRSDEGGSSFNLYGQFGEAAILSVDLGHTLEFDPSGMSSGCALESHNPICSYEYTWRDSHPIPFASYNIWGRIHDWSFGNLLPYHLVSAYYQPEWLKAGTIVSRSEYHSVYSYTVRCVVISGDKVSSQRITVTGVLMKYNAGRWVLLSKQGENTWHIIPTSQLYWKNAVDYLRQTSGF